MSKIKTQHNVIRHVKKGVYMVFKEKEKNALEDLVTQEKSCVQKYTNYAEQAKDPVLKDLFTQLKEEEQKHLQSLKQVLAGEGIPSCDCNDSEGADYKPTATYEPNDNQSEDKKADCFLATDCIATEKLVSSEYNNDVFVFGNTAIRKLLADIQIEEQNHAEMLWKYKTVNGMA